ncbi:MAG: IPT/TIG domain-containing protein [Treponema sp.]|jgi:transglutaminase-like putative cysteine protease|nr:IPT/TIG domain-containing protein [Treponema sp.]
MNRVVTLLACCFLLSLSCKEDGPVILAIDPTVGLSGETLTISGERFGNERGYITIAAAPLPINSSYLEWSDTLIRVIIPDGETGLLYVYQHGKQSNPAVFANHDSIPVLTQQSGSTTPVIDAVKPVAASIGALITIQGSGFGAAREGGGVFFTWAGEAQALFPASEPDYELWNDREIQVRVPDGAAGGHIEVHTSGGTSQQRAFAVTGKPGTKTYTEQKRYTITYTVDIQADSAENPNTLYLWVPEPVASASQWNVERLERSMKPFAEQYQGTTIFQLNDLVPGENTGLLFSYIVDVYAIATSVKQAAESVAVSSGLGSQNPGYTMPTALIPSDDAAVAARAAAIIGRERNTYEQARLIYEWLITECSVQSAWLGNSALDALERKRADPFSASLLFCALARAAGIVAIPVAGVLIDRTNTAIPHYWAEFWLDNFGWVPLDAALGAGAAPPTFNAPPSPATYYFGNLDNQRLTFSRGLTMLSQMDIRGRTKTRDGAYALQNVWEEAVGGLESYTSRWSAIIISGQHRF